MLSCGREGTSAVPMASVGGLPPFVFVAAGVITVTAVFFAWPIVENFDGFHEASGLESTTAPDGGSAPSSSSTLDGSAVSGAVGPSSSTDGSGEPAPGPSPTTGALPSGEETPELPPEEPEPSTNSTSNATTPPKVNATANQTKTSPAPTGTTPSAATTTTTASSSPASGASPTGLPAPLGLVATTGPETREVTLEWSPPPAAAPLGYQVYVAPQPTGPYEPAGSTTDTTYVHEAEDGGSTFYYQVTALYPGGESAPAGPAAAVAGPESGSGALPTPELPTLALAAVGAALVALSTRRR